MMKIYTFTDKDNRKVQYMGEFPPTDEVIETIHKLKNGEDIEEVDFDTVDYDTAVKAQKAGKTVEWYCDRDNTWNTCDPASSELVMARDIKAPLRIKNIISTIKNMDNPFEEE